jgi:ligand-binding sensor domain-containing protein
MAWAEGTLWVGQYRARKIHQIDPDTGKILRTIDTNRFVTGVTWVEGELWHGTWEGEESELNRIDPASGKVQESLKMPHGTVLSGLESDGRERFFCGAPPRGRADHRSRGPISFSSVVSLVTSTHGSLVLTKISKSGGGTRRGSSSEPVLITT